MDSLSKALEKMTKNLATELGDYTEYLEEEGNEEAEE